MQRSRRSAAGQTTGSRTVIYPSEDAAVDVAIPQMKSLQKFTSAHASLHNHFSQERHLVDRKTYKQRRSAALAE